MDFDVDKLLDRAGWEILRLLQENARLPFAEIGKRVGLSAPGVADRVRRMEEAGLIEGYQARVSAAALGFPLTAFMEVSAPWDKAARFAALARESPEVRECHFITGRSTYIAKVAVSSVAHLAALIERLEAASEVTTSVVLTTPIPPRPVGRDLYDTATDAATKGERP